MGTANTNIFFVNLDLGLKSGDENLTGARATVATVCIRPWCTVTEPILFWYIEGIIQ